MTCGFTGQRRDEPSGVATNFGLEACAGRSVKALRKIRRYFWWTAPSILRMKPSATRSLTSGAWAASRLLFALRKRAPMSSCAMQNSSCSRKRNLNTLAMLFAELLQGPPVLAEVHVLARMFPGASLAPRSLAAACSRTSRPIFVSSERQTLFRIIFCSFGAIALIGGAYRHPGAPDRHRVRHLMKTTPAFSRLALILSAVDA